MLRGGAEMPVPALLAAAPRPAREMRRYDATALGFLARELADDDLDDPRMRGVSRGVGVDTIGPVGWAARRCEGGPRRARALQVGESKRNGPTSCNAPPRKAGGICTVSTAVFMTI